MEAVAAKTISLLMANIKLRKFIAVSREVMEEALKALKIGTKVLARRSNAIWDILLAMEEAMKTLAGSILTMKMLRQLQMKYMGTQKTCITLHGVTMYITGPFVGLLLGLQTSRGAILLKS